MSELERGHRQMTKVAMAQGPRASIEPVEGDESKLRFRAAGMAANRKRLGLSAEDFGRLVGATGQSVYAWEAGRSKPRAQALVAISELRGICKREAAKRLAALG